MSEPSLPEIAVQDLKAEVDELRGQFLALAGQTNQTFLVAKEARDELRTFRAHVLPLLARLEKAGKAPTLAAGGVLAVLVNQLAPQLDHMGAAGPTPLVLTLGVLLSTLLLSRLAPKPSVIPALQEAATKESSEVSSDNTDDEITRVH
jgi:hypothetical protein